MVWKEALHPRDRIGRFDEPPGSPQWLRKVGKTAGPKTLTAGKIAPGEYIQIPEDAPGLVERSSKRRGQTFRVGSVQPVPGTNQVAVYDDDDHRVAILEGTTEVHHDPTGKQRDAGKAVGMVGFEDTVQRQTEAFKGKTTRGQTTHGMAGYASNPEQYSRINTLLRDPNVHIPKSQAWRDAIYSVTQIDDVFADDAAVLPEDTEIYRGIRGVDELFPGGINVGDEFADDAYVSTSFSHGYAAGFAANTEPENFSTSAVFKIRAPKGTRGVAPLATSGDSRSITTAKEFELLLPRGTRFRVVGKLPDTEGVYKDKDGIKSLPITTYEVEIVETPVKPPLTPQVAAIVSRMRGKTGGKELLDPNARDFKPKEWPSADRQAVAQALSRAAFAEGLSSWQLSQISQGAVAKIAADNKVTVGALNKLIKSLR